MIASREEVYDSLKADNKLSSAMSNFLLCNKESIFEALSLVIEEKGKGIVTVKSDNKARDVERNLSHGFYTFRQEKKKKNTFREISIPEKRIRAMQEAIGLRISKISLSTAAIGGEAGYDHIQNAETHRHNQYMYSTDLKDAFPSVSAERIYTNLYSALEKIFAYSYSYLDKQQYETFVSTLIHFVTHKDKLPQGSTTSNNLINIVMAGMDKDIIQYLHKEELGLIEPTYTRYVDDLVISYNDIPLYQEQIKSIDAQHGEINKLIEQKIYSSDHIKTVVENTRSLIHDCFSYNSFDARQHIQPKIEAIKNAIASYLKRLDGRAYERIKKLLDDVIAMEAKVATAKGKGSIDKVQENIRKILSNHGRQIQENKDHIRHPGSHKELREVTGISINPKGDLSLPKAKMQNYIDFLHCFVYTTSNLPKKYWKDNQLIYKKVKLSIDGHRRYIERVRGKGNLPSEYKHLYDKAIEKLGT